jgi:hypothetical protein
MQRGQYSVLTNPRVIYKTPGASILLDYARDECVYALGIGKIVCFKEQLFGM